ncbi:MAG: hypothetical protein OHK0023_24080 [Anaerolineae bacterium]
MTERDKGRLIKSLHAQRFMLEVALEPIAPEEWLIPGVAGDWTLKDMIAHIAAWDVRGTQWILAAGRDEMPHMPLPDRSWADLDAINAETYLAWRDTPLAEVQQAFIASFPPLDAACQALSEAQVAQQITFYNGREIETMPVGRLIAWRYRHYRAHAAQIKAWWGTLHAKD